jgi:hypothetical protein
VLCSKAVLGKEKEKRPKPVVVTNVWYHGCKIAQTPDNKVMCCRENVENGGLISQVMTVS